MDKLKGLVTFEQAESRSVGLMNVAKTLFERDGSLWPVAAVMMPTEVALLRPYEIDERGKDLFSTAIKHLAKTKKAAAVLLIMEVWIVEVEKANTSLRDASEAFIRPSLHPDRNEVVYVTLEHVDHMKIWKAEIIRNGGKATLGPFVVVHEGQDVSARGRFMNLLSRESRDNAIPSG